MPPLLTITRDRLVAFFALCVIVVAYLYSYAAGYRSGLQTFAYLVTVACLPWLFRALPNRAASRNSETQPPGLWLPPWDAKTQLPVNEFLAFFVVVSFGVLLRFWLWDSVPVGLWKDEINVTAVGLRLLDGEPTHFLGVMALLPEDPSWNPMFNFYNYYVALNVKLFGAGQFGVKMLSILPGCAALPAFYWLLREIRGPRLAVIGTLMLSMSRWHLTHSRSDYGIALMAAIGVFALASLFRGIRTRRLHWVAVGGALVGLTPYCYLAGWLIAAGVFAWLATLTVFGQRGFPRFRSHALSALIVCIFSFLVTAAPNLLFIHTDIAAGTSRVRQVSGKIVDFENLTVDWEKLGSRIDRHVEAIVTRGPTSARMNIPGKPLLLPIISALSILGACAQLAFRRGMAHPMTWSIFCFSLLGGVLTRGNEVAEQRIVFALPILYLWAAHGLEIVGSLLQRLGALIRERFTNARASWIRYGVGSILGVAIFYPGLRDTHDYFGHFGNLEASLSSRAVLMSKAAEQYRGTHQIWIDAGLLNGPKQLDVLLWRPKKELYGHVIGGLSDPWYQWVSFNDWKSFPYPEGDTPIAFLSSVGRPRQLGSVFESLESREFPNWHETGPLFSVSFIDPGELTKELARVRIDPEEASEALAALGLTLEELDLMHKGHGLLGTYYDGNVWSAAAETLSPTAVEEGRVNKTQIDMSIDFSWRESRKPAPSFSVEWKGYLQIDRSGDYVFAIESNGGSAVYVDSRRVVQNWGKRHDRKTHEGRLHLDKGLHALAIRYDGHLPRPSVRFLWKTGDEPFSVVPAENLWVAR
jgi:hypothetical protein